MAVSKRPDASGEAIRYENQVREMMKRIMLPKRPDGEVYTTSRDIAKVFGKRHDDVLKAIKNLKVPQQFARRNFAGGEYYDKNNQLRKEYRITEKGFNLLVMGFTGKEAALYKVAFVEAFSAMQTHLFEKKQEWIEELALKADEERRLLLDNSDLTGKDIDNLMRLTSGIRGISMRQAQRERFEKQEEDSTHYA